MAALEPFRKTGKFQVLEHTEVTQIDLKAPTDPCCKLTVVLHDGSELECDYLWAAVGVELDASRHPLLREVMQSHPITTIQGLPHLTEDLQWNEHLPLFVMGEMAALHLGPGAVNLMGGRAGASRVSRRLKQLFPDCFSTCKAHHELQANAA